MVRHDALLLLDLAHHIDTNDSLEFFTLGSLLDVSLSNLENIYKKSRTLQEGTFQALIMAVYPHTTLGFMKPNIENLFDAYCAMGKQEMFCFYATKHGFKKMLPNYSTKVDTGKASRGVFFSEGVCNRSFSNSEDDDEDIIFDPGFDEPDAYPFTSSLPKDTMLPLDSTNLGDEID